MLLQNICDLLDDPALTERMDELSAKNRQASGEGADDADLIAALGAARAVADGIFATLIARVAARRDAPDPGAVSDEAMRAELNDAHDDPDSLGYAEMLVALISRGHSLRSASEFANRQSEGGWRDRPAAEPRPGPGLTRH